MAPSCLPAPTGVLAQSAVDAGLAGYLMARADLGQLRHMLTEAEGGHIQAHTRAVSNGTSCWTIIAHNVLYSDKPVHTPLPPSSSNQVLWAMLRHAMKQMPASAAPLAGLVEGISNCGTRMAAPAGDDPRCVATRALLLRLSEAEVARRPTSAPQRSRAVLPRCGEYARECNLWSTGRPEDMAFSEPSRHPEFQESGSSQSTPAGADTLIGTPTHVGASDSHSAARRKRRGADGFAAAVRERYLAIRETLPSEIGPGGPWSRSEICNAIEATAVRQLYGSVTRKRNQEGRAIPGPLSLMPLPHLDTGGRVWGRMMKTGHAAAEGERGYRAVATNYARLVPRSALASAIRAVTPAEVAAYLQARRMSIPIRDTLRARFPRKAMREAATKVNVYLDCVLTDLHNHAPDVCYGTLLLLHSIPAGTLYDDQVVGAIVHSYASMGTHGYYLMLSTLLCGLMVPTVLKGVSDVLKATGSNICHAWAMVTELHTIQGRGASGLDLRADALSRTAAGRGNAVPVPREELESAVAAILAEELGPIPLQVESLDKHWERRFEWCVAGGHAAVTNRECGFPEVPTSGPGGIRVTRRVAMEYTAANPVLGWDGTVRVSVVPKLEHGKTRAIYSCNSVSYVAFSRILRPAERRWAGKRVIVDPGAGGNYGMFRRIRHAWPATQPVALMLDYADFNSQHTLEAQQIVIEQLLARCPTVSPEERTQLVSSFEKMYLFLDGEPLGRVQRSLMSGHRGTSFINSVLNAAYIRLAVGEDVYSRIHSFHVGDDVLVFCKDEVEAYDIVSAMRLRGFQLQGSKQSVGRAGFEFLRMAGTKTAAHGYLARAVASCVSGNWTTDERPGDAADLQNMVQLARALINRSSNSRAWHLLESSIHVRSHLPREALREVLSGTVAIGNGPCFRSDGRYETREFLCVPEAQDRLARALDWRVLPRHATADYFFRGRSDLEGLSMELVGYKPWGAALRSSYGDLAVIASKLEPTTNATPPANTVSLGCRTLFSRSGEVALDTELDKDVLRGKLAQYPIIAMLQHALTDAQLGELLRAAGISHTPGEERITAFGGVRDGAVVRGWLPYADAAALGTRALGASVRVPYPLKM